MSPGSQKILHYLSLTAGTILIALLGARPYAGAWNDGSRLATVESLVDYHTWCIDESVFVNTPDIITKNRAKAYPPSDPGLAATGTLDKLFIRDHYYSDKSPLPALVMAGVYHVLQAATGLNASANPQLFCYLMALIFSGGAYVVAVFCMDATAGLLGLSWRARLLLTWSFALATVALTYSREVNNHIMLLAVFSAAMLFAMQLEQPGKERQWQLLLLGSLMGIGYPIDLGTGPVLVLCVTVLVAAQTRSARDVALLLLASFPWFVMHHLLNYKIGGTFKPANAVPEYFKWPGCPFNSGNLTGGWSHKGVLDFLLYAGSLFFGKKGFIWHNIPLLLSIPAAAFLLRNKVKHQRLAWFSMALIFGTWLMYAITSSNSSGMCISIRWFVPLLVPFYFLIAAFVKERPEFTADLAVLAGWGLIMGVAMWLAGPWAEKAAPAKWFWISQGCVLISWLGWRLLPRHQSERKS